MGCRAGSGSTGGVTGQEPDGEENEEGGAEVGPEDLELGEALRHVAREVQACRRVRMGSHCLCWSWSKSRSQPFPQRGGIQADATVDCLEICFAREFESVTDSGSLLLCLLSEDVSDLAAQLDGSFLCRGGRVLHCVRDLSRLIDSSPVRASGRVLFA
jgi:hypothetical protein